MSIKSEISQSWAEWKFGAIACVLIALQAVVAAAGSALISAAILIPIYWIAGGKAPDQAVYNLAFVFSIILVPTSVRMAVETLSDMADEAETRGRTK